LRKVGLLHVAEELVQDAFIDFYETRDRIKDTSLAYLKTILRNKIYDYYHKRKTSLVIPLYNEEDIDITVAPSVMDGLYEREINKLLNQQIILLPEQCRNVFLMSRQEELSNKEIAARLGISVKTVEGHITKAIKYLREHMNHHWVWYLFIELLDRSSIMHHLL
jgi:RNA polymerase sigma-70 factor (ECF subfamily)